MYLNRTHESLGTKKMNKMEMYVKTSGPSEKSMLLDA